MGQEVVESLGEVGELVSLATTLADTEEFGTDAEGGQAAGEPSCRDRLVAVLAGRPGAVRQGAKGIDQGAGEEARGTGLGEGGAEVGEEEFADF